jgi:hypothetical protein
VKARWFTLAALLVAVVGALVAAFAPTGQVTETSGSSGGTFVTRSSSVSLFQANGAWILVVVAVPVLVASIPLLFPHRRTRIVATVLLWMGCVVALWSVGSFFVPATILMTIAGSQAEPAPVPPMPTLPVG